MLFQRLYLGTLSAQGFGKRRKTPLRSTTGIAESSTRTYKRGMAIVTECLLRWNCRIHLILYAPYCNAPQASALRSVTSFNEEQTSCCICENIPSNRNPPNAPTGWRQPVDQELNHYPQNANPVARNVWKSSKYCFGKRRVEYVAPAKVAMNIGQAS